MVYFPELTIQENANKNGVSVYAVRKYIHVNKIDRRTDEKLKKRDIILRHYNNGKGISEIATITGYSTKTVSKYINDFSVETLYESIDKDKVSVFNANDNEHIIKSISDSQNDILKNILFLYCKTKTFDCDLTYSEGKFYKRIPSPALKFDKYPVNDTISQLNCAYNIDETSLESVIVDLPFIIKPITKSPMIIKDRFNSFDNQTDMENANVEMMKLANYLLRKGGILVMKTQDTNFAGKQIWTSDFILSKAQSLGFTLEDKFILRSNHVLTSRTLYRQKHSRKYHSYFLVFRKVTGISHSKNSNTLNEY